MLTWLQIHWGTILVFLVLLAVIAAAIASVVHDRRSGKNGCGCGCRDCTMRGECHKKHRDSE